MNKQRRTALAKALPLIEQAQKLLADAAAIVESVRDDERDVYEGMSEGQQSGDLGDAMQTAISDMEEAIDGIGGIDLQSLAQAVGRACDEEEGLAPPTLTERELDERRTARLPAWAKRRIAAAEEKASAAAAQLADVFTEADPEDRTQIVIDDYDSPVRGRVVPSDQVAFPGHKIRVQAERRGRGVMIDGTDMGVLSIIPQASNSVLIRLERLL